MSAPVALTAGHTLDEVARLGVPTMCGEPTWLTAVRRDATQWVADHGFPTRKHEDWRYLDLEPLLGLPLSPAGWDGPLPASGLAGLAIPDLGGHRLVMVNGRFAPELSRLGSLPAGTRVLPLGSAITDDSFVARRYWPAPGHKYLHAFEALNAALAVDGCVVELGDGVSVAVPIEIAHISTTAEDAVVSSPRIVVFAGEGSSATVVETYIGTGEGVYVTNAHTGVVLGRGARLEHYRLQGESDRSFHLSTLDVRPGAESHFSSRLVAVGSRVARHEVHVRLEQEGATVDLDGLYLPSGEQCHDNPVRIEHVAPLCTSHQLYKGIVDAAAHGIFNGHVIVHPGAVGTDAEQTNKNLLLSDLAEVDTRPRLEIFADEVSCTHGAAVGQLDTDAMFYLRSRGIPEWAARSLLISGFARQVLERFVEGPIRERAEQLVTTHLQAVEGESGSSGGAR